MYDEESTQCHSAHVTIQHDRNKPNDDDENTTRHWTVVDRRKEEDDEALRVRRWGGTRAFAPPLLTSVSYPLHIVSVHPTSSKPITDCRITEQRATARKEEAIRMTLVGR